MLRDGISNEAYHSDPALGRSVADRLLTSCPAKVKHDMENPQPSTSALTIGSMVHCATLEPDKLDSEFGCKPAEIDGNSSRTNAYKEAFARMQDENPGKKWLPPSDYNMCLEVAASAREHPLMQELLYHADTKIEHTGFFELEGASCKVRPDLFNASSGIVADLKTTQDASPRGFAKSVRQFGYAFQAAWYMTALRVMGEKPKKFVFLVVEKSAPYVTACYTLNQSDIDREIPRVHEACKLWAKCVKEDVWPGYSDDITTLNLGTLYNQNRLSVTKIAEHFGVSRSYVYTIQQKYKLEMRKVGNKQTIGVAEFNNALRWMNEGKDAA